MMKVFKALSAFVFFAAFGFYISYQSWGGEVFLAVQNLNSNSLRDPAAVKKVFDFSQFEGSVFSSTSKKRLIQDAKIEKQAGRFGVELGHFVARIGGEQMLACQAYDRVVLYFEAEGVAVDGEIPSMEVEGNCNVSEDVNKMGTLWVPVEKIQSAPVADGEFNFPEDQITVRFAHVADAWPNRWLMKRVGLKDSNSSRPLMDVGAADLDVIDYKKLKIDWSTL